MLTHNVNHKEKSPLEIIFWGGTGQAIVNRPIINYYGDKLVAIFDDTPDLKSPFDDVPLYMGWEGFRNWIKNRNSSEIGFCIAIGNPHGRVRMKLHEKLVNEGLKPVNLIHPSAIIADNVKLGDGVQIMAGAVIQPNVIIGNQCIINTKASVDHDCILSDGVEITVGATLCGNVYMETNSWICAGATVLPRIKIGQNSIIGAGSVVTKDMPPNVIAYGVPARVIRKII
jgi:sugar O-acyltransferase (sialic acid O-acetyltransferase NeuD family)